jgi:thiol-disulfide isomerase/thioredoxin
LLATFLYKQRFLLFFFLLDMNSFLFLVFVVVVSLVTVKAAVSESEMVENIVPLTYGNLSTNLLEWEQDLAVMFHAPWCKYCKLLAPSWGTIAAWNKNKRDLVVASFDCEETDEHMELCRNLGIDRYPSLSYFGYGNFNQGYAGKVIGRPSDNPRVVKFLSDLYPEALLDWVNMLHFMSRMNRYWDDFAGLFTGRSRAFKAANRYKQRTIEAERKAQLFSAELERYQANEAFDLLSDYGDPFPLLNSLDPDEVHVVNAYVVF